MFDSCLLLMRSMRAMGKRDAARDGKDGLEGRGAHGEIRKGKNRDGKVEEHMKEMRTKEERMGKERRTWRRNEDEGEVRKERGD
jgi:hypothetical protein